MINSKRLVELARKWQKKAAVRRQRLSFTNNGDGLNSSSVSNKGHFVVYTTDKTRFTVPLKYLSRSFGLSINGPITLPCNSTFLKYVLSLFRGGMSEDLEKSLLTSLTTCHISVSLLGQEMSHHQQTLIYSY
ncbi:hypothetical protein ACOSQ2_006137 [Xanthoceras sorbifolium]